jgi:tripartite-type tricarboxylate transporter receptor subunit TctC
MNGGKNLGKKYIKILSLFMMLVLVLYGCNNAESSGDTSQSDKESENIWPEKPIKLIIPFDAGGGTDLSARALQPYLEKELGVSVVVENKPGAAGWLAWSELAGTNPDGYTIGYMNFPNIIAGYLNPETKRTESLDSYTFISNHVADTGILVVNAEDERFKDIDSFVEYAQKNELIVSSSGVGSANHFVGVQMIDQLDTKFRFVQTDGTAEAISSVLGGHIDVLLAGNGEVMELISDGRLLPLAVFGDERIPSLPDVPTLNETMDTNIDIMLSRGIAAPAGLDDEITKKLTEAITKAAQDPEHIKRINDLGMKVDTINGEEYLKSLKEQEERIKSMKSVFGW